MSGISQKTGGISLRGLIPQLFLIILPLTLIFVLIPFASLSLHQQAMRDLVGERDERTARSVARAIQELLNHRLSTVHSLALRIADGASPTTVISTSTYLIVDFDGGLAFYSADGETLAATPRIVTPPDLKTHLTGTSIAPQISEPFVDPASGEHFVAVFARQNDLFLVGTFSVTGLIQSTLVEAFLPGEEASAFIIDNSHQLIFQTGSPFLSSEGHEHPGITEALQGKSGTTYVQQNGNAHEHVVAYSPIAPVNWALVIEETWEHVDNPLLRTTQIAPLVLVPPLLLAVLALAFGIRQIVSPLQKLANKAAQLGWGKFEAIEESVGGVAEIRRLQTELIHMAHKVQASQESLHDYISAITTGQEEERHRLARELHDDTLQSLIALNQRIQLTALSVNDPSAAAQIAEIQALTTQTIADLRRLTRALRPIYLEDLGLVTALEMLVHETSARLPIEFQRAGHERRLGAETELALYRMAQEALSNALRHSQATSAVLAIRFEPDKVTMTISDNGRGFAIPETPAEFAKQGHFGLLGLHERTELIGAALEIRSTIGQGTQVVVRLPTENTANLS